MQKDGCSLATILRAGQWRSAAFMKYLDEAELEKVRLVCGFFSSFSLATSLLAQDVLLELGVDSDGEEWVD